MTALVTGASRGIGRAIAEGLRDAGYEVIGTARHPDALRDAPAGIRFLPLELGDPASIDALSAAVGPVDVLINNAGYSLMGPLDETPIETIEALNMVNWLGVVRLTRALLPGMRDHGRIITIGSLQARLPLPYCAMYAGIKAALEAFTRALRFEVRHRGIGVSLVMPGFVHTQIRQEAFAGADDRRFAAVKAFRDRGVSQGIDPQKVARVVVCAVRAKHPKAVYLAGGRARVFNTLRQVLPERLFEAVFRRVVGL